MRIDLNWFLGLAVVMSVALAIGCSSSPSDVSSREGTSSKESVESESKESRETTESEKDSEVNEPADLREESSQESTETASTDTKSSSTSSDAEPWGNLRGQFIYDGTPATLENIVATKDKDFCGKHDIPNETLVINKESKGIGNVVVYLYLKREDDPPPIHESYTSEAEAKVTLDNLQCRFDPHVCLLRTSQTLVVGNKDEVGHNTKIDALNNTAINPLTPAGESFEHQFPSEERGPIGVSCSIHPWMSGWIVVRDNPYFAVTDANGDFEIKNLPAGNWTMQVWHERTRRIANVSLNGKSTSWSRGRADVTIRPGETTDWGKVKVAAGLFAE